MFGEEPIVFRYFWDYVEKSVLLYHVYFLSND